MAYSTSAHSALSVRGAVHAKTVELANNPTGDRGRFFYLEGTRSIVPSDYNTNGDVIDLLTFPPNTRLFGAWVSSSVDMETGGPTLENDLAISDAGSVSQTLVESSTAFRSAAGVISYGISATSGAFQFPGLDVGELQLAVVTDAAATTPAATTVLSFGVFLYHGAVVNLGAG